MADQSDYRAKAKEICGDVDAIRKLLVEIHELKRTRSEAEAAARAQGYGHGLEEARRQIRAMGITVNLNG